MSEARNRRRRLRAAEDARLKAMPPARPDKRPLYFDINAGDRVECYHCLKAGLKGIFHEHRRAVMSDPANPPAGEPKGDMFTICVNHLPDDAVIFNPVTGHCRNKSGDHTWTPDAN